ncbi:HAD-like domain-containing protein [Polychytrium aggregatum]|uniref:HAD-like domain-containing protein n=1 Tax=Polychytrium aggregatum TaxID=110093 RepID=UPI0022FECCC9|nr:HAD-like domain-containing protein [Polychytrium aggregatum]KAI9202768.1 HAD-like domain-containing protein [Polychytrium aggregatum]
MADCFELYQDSPEYKLELALLNSHAHAHHSILSHKYIYNPLQYPVLPPDLLQLHNSGDGAVIGGSPEYPVINVDSDDEAHSDDRHHAAAPAIPRTRQALARISAIGEPTAKRFKSTASAPPSIADTHISISDNDDNDAEADRGETSHNDTPSRLPRPIQYQRKLLLILDLNGVLIDRLVTSQDKSAAQANPFNQQLPSFSCNQCYIHIRPFLRTFLDFIFEHFYVATWTSAKQQNAKNIIWILFQERCHRLVFKYYQTECTDSGRVSGRGKPEFIKELSNIWRNPLYSQWNQSNTLIIDDSSHKSQLNAANSLLVPTFTVRSGSIDCWKDTGLLSIMQYLQAQLQDIHCDDVQQWPPFVDDTTGRILPPFQVTHIREDLEKDRNWGVLSLSQRDALLNRLQFQP